MTRDKEIELMAEYRDCHKEVGQCLLVLLACFATFIFCALKSFLPGVAVPMIIQIVFMFRAEKYQDRMKEIRWELDRG